MLATTPKVAISTDCPSVRVKYHLHRGDADSSILPGSSVLSADSLCPPFEACPNRNLFQHYFGVEFYHDSTFAPFPPTNSLVALVSSTGCNIDFLTSPTGSVSMHPCQPRRPPGSLTKFTPILCTCGTRTAKSSHQISLQHLRHPSRH